MQSSAATLRLAVLPRAGALTDACLVVGGAGFVALAAQVSIHLGFTPVPITGQTFAVLLVGAALRLDPRRREPAPLPGSGSRACRSTPSTGTGGRSSPARPAATSSASSSPPLLIGALAESGWDKQFSSSLSAMLIGNVVIYGFGLLWLHHDLRVNWPTALVDGVYPFLPGDLVKVFLAALALPGAWTLVQPVQPARQLPAAAAPRTGR